MTHMDPSQIGRPAGGTAPAPDDITRRLATAIVGIHGIATTQTQGYCDQPAARRVAEVVAPVLAAAHAALAQPPRPAAVADEDVRRENAALRAFYDVASRYMNAQTGNLDPDQTEPSFGEVLDAAHAVTALAAPAPRDPARDAGETERAVADADVRTPDWSPVCPHCQRIIWQAVPELSRARDYVEARGRVTARDIADAFDWSIQNAHNKLRRLESLGVLKCDGSVALPGGGRAFIFAARAGEEGDHA